ncbi:MAG: hypothetical protein LBJ57_06450 [Prevotellaceae bacterium]|jgi:hypothetical protein|nr:hypothetical protein [Prevotellaceae bacterium]
MVRILKHIITVALCLLVVGGAVGVRFYVFACAHRGDLQLALEKENHGCCCHGDDDDDSCAPKDHEGGAYLTLHEEACCKATTLFVSVSHFEVSQASKLSVELPFIFIPNSPSYCANADSRCDLPIASHAPLIADAVPVPIIYLHGQLRL